MKSNVCKGRYNNAILSLLLGAVAFLITLIIMLIILIQLKCAPFGINTLACMDANVQYLDFFAYLKDVLAGNNAIGYTFSKGLGGCNFAVFSYYLSSPFNILILFFDKSELYSFFDILVVLKLSGIAFASALFLNIRFPDKERHSKYHMAMVCMLSVSYAFCQYNIAQCSNIMWLDGVYMLPLIWLGIWWIVRSKKSWLLTVCIFLSMIFNWYTGAMNCLFSVFIIFFEIFYSWSERHYDSISCYMEDGLRTLIRYGVAMACGLLLSAILFLPTILALSNGSKGSVNLSILLDLSMNGEIASLIQGYTLGATSSLGAVSLFCGSLVLIGSLCCFFTKDITKRKKIILGGMTCLTVLLFYWNPFCNLYILLRGDSGYWYRYSYIGILVLFFLAGNYWLQVVQIEKDKFLPIKIGLGFGGLLLILNYINHRVDTTLLAIDILFLLSIAFVIVFLCFYTQKRITKFIIMFITVALVFSEVGYSTKLLCLLNDYYDADEFASYALGAEIQMNALRKFDESVYRVSETSMRNMGIRAIGLGCNYNEALAYNYWSLSTYTSSPDEVPSRFLDKLGYRYDSSLWTIINTSILAADSLLGVKYIFSAYPINGLEETEIVSGYNGKKVYNNPFCLPFCFIYNPAEVKEEQGNPFVYQDALYSNLIGEDICLYMPVNFSTIQEGNENNSLIYELELPEGHYAFYGNIPWKSRFDAQLNVNEYYKTAYARWLSPSVFYIPVAEGDKTAKIEVSAKPPYDIQYGNEQFYALDLDLLADITSRLQNQEIDDAIYQNGHVKITTEGQSGQMLYTSVPYDRGWSISLNGKEITPELFGDCIYVIPLVDGENLVEMKYHVRGFRGGIMLSSIGILLMIIIAILEKKSLVPKTEESKPI